MRKNPGTTSSFDSTDQLKITGLRQNFSSLSDWFDPRIAWVHYDKDLTRIQQIVPENTHKQTAWAELQSSHPVKLKMLFLRSTSTVTGHRPVSLSLKPETFVSLMTDQPVDIQTYRVWGRQVCGLIQIATNQRIKPQAISVRHKVPSDGSEGIFYQLMCEDSDVNSTLAIVLITCLTSETFVSRGLHGGLNCATAIMMGSVLPFIFRCISVVVFL